MHNVKLLPEKQLVQEKETLLRKQKKPAPERENVQLEQEKVLEEQPEEKVQEEKLQGEELPEEEEDARTSYSFFKLHLIRTVNETPFHSNFYSDR